MPWYAIAALMLAVFAPSAWSGVSAGCAVLSAMILGALGVKMLGLGLAGYMDPRNRPFGLARDYARWCKASGRRPVWLFVLVPLWAGYVVALFGAILVTLARAPFYLVETRASELNVA